MKTTPLHAAHLALGAKMGEFAGYDMPLYYGEGVLKEHEWTRSHAGLFDVSHMGQVWVTGPGACGFWQTVTPGTYAALPDGRAKYSVLLNPEGGIIDDLIITRLGADRFFSVVNAGCKDKDIPWLRQNLPADAVLEEWTDRALIALQGPEAENVLRDALGINTVDMPYMWAEEKQGLLISRLGYTGEDGFEVSIPQEQAVEIWNKLLAHSAVKPVGLAARDSLRLEMGYPLYGHDIDDTTSPVEAGLNWIIGKGHSGFIGGDRVIAELSNGVSRQRVGIRLTDRGIAREGAELRDETDRKIGILTSGSFAPTLKASIGQGYIESAFANPGQKIFVNVRGNNIAAEVVALSFVPSKTKSMKKNAA